MQIYKIFLKKNKTSDFFIMTLLLIFQYKLTPLIL